MALRGCGDGGGGLYFHDFVQKNVLLVAGLLIQIKHCYLIFFLNKKS